MNAALRRLGSLMSPLALAVALLALVVSAAGAGYAAGKIGTKDIKDNAVTTAKIKNGTVGLKDLVKQEKQKKPVLGTGGEGDCLWQSGAAQIPGLGSPAYRKDRFGVVHLSGVAIGSDAGGGDGACDSSDPGQSADAIAFILPKAYMPAQTQIIGGAGSGGTLVVGRLGLVSPGISLPPGAVASLTGGSGGAVILDGVSYEPVGSSVVVAKGAASGRVTGALARQLGLR